MKYVCPNCAVDSGVGWLYQAIGEQQLTLLAWIAADPQLIDVFASAGGDRALFLDAADQPADFDAIFVALQFAHDHGRDRDTAARYAVETLRNAGCWSDADHFGGGSEWTAARLARLFEAGYASAAMVELHTRRLIALRSRLSQANEHLQQARQLVTETADDVRERSQRFDDSVNHFIPRQTSVVVQIRRRNRKGIQCHKKI